MNLYLATRFYIIIYPTCTVIYETLWWALAEHFCSVIALSILFCSKQTCLDWCIKWIQIYVWIFRIQFPPLSCLLFVINYLGTEALLAAAKWSWIYKHQVWCYLLYWQILRWSGFVVRIQRIIDDSRWLESIWPFSINVGVSC